MATSDAFLKSEVLYFILSSAKELRLIRLILNNRCIKITLRSLLKLFIYLAIIKKVTSHVYNTRQFFTEILYSLVIYYIRSHYVRLSKSQPNVWNVIDFYIIHYLQILHYDKIID
jgi:hypothetical protein